MDAEEWVAVEALVDGRRLRPTDDRHVKLLAAVLDDCPPLVVEIGTLRIIDGHMRRDAALMLGRSSVRVTFVKGDAVQLLELALTANAAHGLPLSFPERRAGAANLLALAPEMSSRRVALAAGVSEGTVRAAREELRRQRPGAHDAQVDTRCGVDGKRYPTDPRGRRERAARILAFEPSRSDREVGRMVGLSPTTVAAVRQGLRGRPDVPLRAAPTPVAGRVRRDLIRCALGWAARWWRVLLRRR